VLGMYPPGTLVTVAHDSDGFVSLAPGGAHDTPAQ
jgi:hypothetical protein